DFSIGLAPGSVQVQQGQSATVSVNLTLMGGFAQPVTITATGLPTGVTADPLMIAAGMTTGQLTLHAAATAAQGGPTMVTVTGSAGSLSHNAQLGVLVSGAPGSLDLSFGTGGKFTTQVGGSSRSLGVAVQSDGKILVSGDAVGSTQLLVLRLNPDGTLDSGFGTGGHTTTAIGTAAYGIAVLAAPNGKILVAGGTTSNSMTYDAVVARYSASGALDTTFGNMGTVVTDLGATYDEVHHLFVQPDGKLLAGCLYFDSAGAQAAVIVRYDVNGALDASFATGGKLTVTGFGYGGLVLQSDGKILLGGGDTAGFGVYRYAPTGTLDSTFGSGGRASVMLSATDYGAGLDQLPDGRIVQTGNSVCGSMRCLSAARLSNMGALDGSFGSGGKTLTSIPIQLVRNQALQADGKILATFRQGSGTSQALAVARLTANGGVDTAFGGATGTPGVTAVTFGGTPSDAEDVAVQADGRILVVGVSGAVGATTVAVARLWP
ncbi:MAG TPA: hypothetical protein VKN99_10275, partial [Polyangia bacterium]|nr:hypothetical protein [Polyangia bacterium]